MRSYSFLSRALTLGILTLLAAAGARAERIYGITATSAIATASAQNLVWFDSLSPQTINVVGNINIGKDANHVVRSIDFRPATGRLYAISTDADFPNIARLYTVSIANGSLTPVGSQFLLGPDEAQSPSVEMEFNPVTDEIRVITASPQSAGLDNNFRVNPNTATIIIDADLNYNDAPPADPNATETNIRINAAAYSRNVGGATTLYAWDWGLNDQLVTIGGLNGAPSADTGLLFSVGGQPIDPLSGNQGMGMDISPSTGILYVTHDNTVAVTDSGGTLRNPGQIMGLFTRGTTEATAENQTLIGYYPPSNRFVLDISVQVPITAAEVTVNGFVVTPSGRGLVRALVTLTDSQGRERTLSTGRGGSFKFDNVEAGKTYFITVDSQQYSYDPHVIQVDDTVTGLRISPSSH